MSREVQIIMRSDLDSTLIADEAVEFIYEGIKYTVDLTTEQANEFREMLGLYMDAAHEKQRVGKKPEVLHPKGNGARKAAVPDKEMRRAIRAWAKDQGYKVSDRGLLPAEVTQAFHAAHEGISA